MPRGKRTSLPQAAQAKALADIGDQGTQIADAIRLPVRTVDDIMAEYACDAIDLLKIDIEGGEREVFADASKWIDKVGVLVAELHERYQVGCTRNFYLATRDFDVDGGTNVT